MDKDLYPTLVLSFFTLSLKYLRFVQAVLKETIKQGNTHLVISNDILTDGEYEEKTNWSDFNVLIPILFDFYQGLELSLKGLLFLIKTDDDLRQYEPDHNLIKLFDLINQSEKINNITKLIFEKYLIPEKMPQGFLVDFLKTNNLNINQLYESLRYPADKKFRSFYKYYELQYKEGESLQHFNYMVEDIENLSREIVKLYKSSY